jgi:hypothetical protein
VVRVFHPKILSESEAMRERQDAIQCSHPPPALRTREAGYADSAEERVGWWWAVYPLPLSTVTPAD